MYKNKIQKLVKENFKSGYSLEDIRTVLRLYGWNDKYINEAFKEHNVPSYYQQLKQKQMFWENNKNIIAGISVFAVIIISITSFLIFPLNKSALSGAVITDIDANNTDQNINNDDYNNQLNNISNNQIAEEENLIKDKNKE